MNKMKLKSTKISLFLLLFLSNIVFTYSQLFNVFISNSTNVSCFGGNDGSAESTPVGGISPYSYNWLPSGGNSNIANNLTAGVYTVVVTDANMVTASSSVTITQPTVLNCIITNYTPPTSTISNDGSATVTAFGGSPSYTYNWSPSGGTGITANNLSSGNYFVTVTDSKGCTTHVLLS